MPKKILILTNIYAPEIGGPASYARIVAPELQNTYSVTLLTYSPVWSFKDDDSKPYKIIRVWKKWPRFIRHPLYFFKGLWYGRASDLILALSPINPGLTARLCHRLFGKPYIVRLVGDWAWEYAANAGKTALLIDDFQKSKKSGRIWFFDRTQRLVCKQAAAIIVPSKYLRNIVSGWGVDQPNIHQVVNCTDFKPSSVTREEAKKKIGIPGVILVSVGRLVPWKGFRMLIKLMPRLLEINGFFRLVIVGDGPERETLQTFVQNLGLEKKVYIVGRKSPAELEAYLKAADVMVLNTGYEGFSHLLLEAMAVGLPVVTTSAGGNREIIKQGENGFLVKYNDEFNLIEAIKTIWYVHELRQKMIENGFETVKRFPPERTIAETKEVLEGVLK